MILRSGLPRMAHPYDALAEKSLSPQLARDAADLDLVRGGSGSGGGASGSFAEGCGMLVVSCEQDDREVNPFRHGRELRCLPYDNDAGRHDHGEPVDAEGKDLLRVSRTVGGIAAARAQHERVVCGLSRRT